MDLKRDAVAVRTAARCRHYAKCKIDYLGTGVCRPGLEKGFVSYYPQGRMDKDFFIDLYSRPEVTDMRWLNMFRILSPRMGRKKHIISWILYLPIDRGELIEEIDTSLSEIGDRHGVDHDFGFLTSLDFGKRGVLEYDFFVDQTDPEDEGRMLASMAEAEKMIEDLCSRIRGVRWIKYLFNQGFSRKEGFLYT